MFRTHSHAPALPHPVCQRDIDASLRSLQHDKAYLLGNDCTAYQRRHSCAVHGSTKKSTLLARRERHPCYHHPTTWHELACPWPMFVKLRFFAVHAVTRTNLTLRTPQKQRCVGSTTHLTSCQRKTKSVQLPRCTRQTSHTSHQARGVGKFEPRAASEP